MTIAIPRHDLDLLHQATALYTVSPVVDALLDKIGWPDADGCLIDPSAGDGMFLARALARLPIAPDDFTQIERICGWEIHPEAVKSGHARLCAQLVGRGWTMIAAREAARRILRQGDFITEAPAGVRYRFVAGNPPYMLFRRLPEAFKSLYRPIFCNATKGDLLHAFLDRCAALMTDDGVIGLVTSDRWLFNETAATLRSQLGGRVGIDHLARLDADTSFYRPKQRQKGSPPRVHPVEVVMRSAGAASITLTAAPISPDGRAVEPTGPTLSDIATIRLAPWLGPDNIFLIGATVAAALPPEHLVPAVDTHDFDATTGQMRDPTRFVIRTHRDHAPPAIIQEHLRRELHRMPRRGQNKTWWVPPEKLFESVAHPALLIPRIAKSIRPIRLSPGIMPVNHNLYVVSAGARSLDEIEGILTAPATQDFVARNAPRLENGYLDIRATLIRRIPISVGTQHIAA